VCCDPEALNFKPCGIPERGLETVRLTLDELEALRLADFEELYQENAADKMNISRQTFGNIIASAHKKVADFLTNSKHLSIEGGSIMQCKKKNNHRAEGRRGCGNGLCRRGTR
jgi:predicted DNA-binding protein (UPF0251 family)